MHSLVIAHLRTVAHNILLEGPEMMMNSFNVFTKPSVYVSVQDLAGFIKTPTYTQSILQYKLPAQDHVSKKTLARH